MGLTFDMSGGRRQAKVDCSLQGLAVYSDSNLGAGWLANQVTVRLGLRSLSVLLVLRGSLDRSQPRLAALDPEFIAWHERGGGFRQDPELDFRLSIIGREQSRSAARAEVLTAEFRRFTQVFKLVDGPDCIERKGRTAFLSAVGAVADADAKGFTANRNMHLPAKASSRMRRHG